MKQHITKLPPRQNITQLQLNMIRQPRPSITQLQLNMNRPPPLNIIQPQLNMSRQQPNIKLKRPKHTSLRRLHLQVGRTEDKKY